MEFPSGWLVKGGGSFRNWRKRWAQFVKDDEVLLIYDRPSGRLKRTVTLKSIESVVAMSESKKWFAFAIVERRDAKTPHTVCFYVEGKDYFDSWLGAFARCVECNKRTLKNVRKAVICSWPFESFAGKSVNTLALFARM
jgi:hypothetical protein